MMLLFVGCLSAGAVTPPDLSRPDELAVQSAQRLVDLSAIEFATVTVQFGDAAASTILGAPAHDALLAYVAKTKAGAKKDAAGRIKETVRLEETVRFEAQVGFDERRGTFITVRSVDWGELRDFSHRPSDEEACRGAENVLLASAGMWVDLHLSGTGWWDSRKPILRAVDGPSGIDVSVADTTGTGVFELEHGTLLPLSIRIGDAEIRFRYRKSGERNLLEHFDTLQGALPVAQIDFTFADIHGVPWPEAVVRTEGPNVLTMHFSDMVLKQRAATERSVSRNANGVAPQLNPAGRHGWQAALDAIDASLYTWSPAEKLHFTIARASDSPSWISADEIEDFIKKRLGAVTAPDKVAAEVARLNRQVTYDVDVTLDPLSIWVSKVHLGELEGSIAATHVEAIRKRAEDDIFRLVLGVPNAMMLVAPGFFSPTDLPTAVERDPNGLLLTLPSAKGPRRILLDYDGLPWQILWPDGSRFVYRFKPGPSGKMLLEQFAFVDSSGRLTQRVVYAYGEVEGVTVPTLAQTILSTFTLTNWRVDDTAAPFLARDVSPAR